MNEEVFKKSTFSEEEVFHPKTLEVLRNESLFIFKQQYSSYYGLCYVLQMLTPVKISDYSFQVVINKSLDYNYYLHEPLENEWLFMSVYPYEVTLNWIDAKNDDDIGAADIIMRKEIIKKIPGKGGCKDILVSDLIECWIKKLAESLSKANIRCKVPALRFTQFNTDHLDYCTNKEDALEVEGIIYNEAIKNLEKSVCPSLCTTIKYHQFVSLLSKNVLSKELKIYGDGYFIIWQFYSTLYVNEKVETYIFDFDSALVAIGGSLGLFLGWSIMSMILDVAEYCNESYKLRNQRKVENKKSTSPEKTIRTIWEPIKYVDNIVKRID